MSDADVMISALHSGDEALAEMVRGLSDDDLARPSAAAKWDVSRVLGHLGSMAENSQAGWRAALDGKPRPGPEYAQEVRARWDGWSRRERADGFLTARASWNAFLAALPTSARESLRIELGAMPAPVDAAAALRIGLNELTHHSWDVRAAFDPAAALDPDAVVLLVPIVHGMIRFLGKRDALGGAESVIEVTTTDPSLRLALTLGPRIGVSEDIPASTDGTLKLPAEAWLRLLMGRLKEQYTPASVTATGAADLDLLRKVFRGF